MGRHHLDGHCGEGHRTQGWKHQIRVLQWNGNHDIKPDKEKKPRRRNGSEALNYLPHMRQFSDKKILIKRRHKLDELR